MKVSVNVDNKELIKSSVVHIQYDQEMVINIEGLKFKFIFIEDDEDKSSGYKGSVEDDAFVMRLKNFSNGFGEGVLKPIEVGYINNRKLYITFYVSTVSNKDRRFEYNLFLDAES